MTSWQIFWKVTKITAQVLGYITMFVLAAASVYYLMIIALAFLL